MSLFASLPSALEKRGSFEASRTPAAVQLSQDGKAVLVLSKGGEELEFSSLDEIGSRERGENTLTRRLQAALAALRYPVNVVDGRIGPETIESLKAFEHSAGLPVTGAVTDATVARVLKSQSWFAECEERPSSSCLDRRVEDKFVEETARGWVIGRICKSIDGSERGVQIDRYESGASGAGEYKCTSFSDCASIRFVAPAAFRAICSSR